MEDNVIVKEGNQKNHTHGSKTEEITVLTFMGNIRTSLRKDPSQLLEKVYR